MPKDKLPKNLLCCKSTIFVFIHNASLCETAKMYCEAAIYSFEAIISIPLFIIILSTLTDK